MAKYTVSMAIDGRIDVEVEAKTPDEAFEAAKDAFMDVDLKDIEILDSRPVNCYNNKGDIVKVY